MACLIVILLYSAAQIAPLQKAYGAKSDRAVRLGVGLNGLGLCYAIVPTVLGMAARRLHRNLDNRELALPMIFMHDLPFWVGALGLASSTR